MKPHKAARRRKRPFRTVVHPPPKTWFDRIAPYFFSIGFLISFLMVGYGEACKYVFSHRAIWTYMVQHDIQLPHVWLKKQFERLDLPIREANAESEAQSTEHILYLHTDHMGRVIAATDEQANQTHAATTDPFGKPKDGNPGPTNLGFPGQYYDKETGLYYNYHRAYNPSTGRYVQADPRRGSPPAALDALARQSFLPPYLRKARAALMLANNGASNIVVPEVDTPDPYSYARGNPVNRIDPQGLMSSYDSAVLTAIATGRLADAAQLIENAGGSPAAVEALRRASIFRLFSQLCGWSKQLKMKAHR
jgi:RHS repeat-associated protein